MDHLIIAISREFGSGGKFIGEQLAQTLGVPFYDKMLLQLTAQRSGLSPDFLEKSEEQASGSFLFNLSTAAHAASNFFYQYNVSVNDKAFFAQAAVIREIAERGSSVIVGRCAEHVLREHKKCLKIFLHAPLDWRITQIMRDYDMSESDAKERILRVDKGRANYYRHYTGETWGAVKTHDLCINTAVCGLKGAVEGILAIAREMKGDHHVIK